MGKSCSFRYDPVVVRRVLRPVRLAAAVFGARHVPAEARLLTGLLTAGLLLFSASRAAFTFLFADRLADVPLPTLIAAFGVGVVVDMSFLAWLLVPVWVLCFLPRWHWAERRTVRGLLVAWVAFCTFWLLVGVISDLAHFREFDTRLNGVSLDYLRQPWHLLVVLHHEFSLVPVAAVLALLTVVGVRILLKRLPRLAAVAAQGRTRATLAALSFVAISLGCLTSLAEARSHWGGPWFSDSYSANQLALNGPQNLVSALMDELGDEEASRERFYALPEADAVRTVREVVAADPGAFVGSGANPVLRTVDTGRPRRDLNVVLVLMESFDARGIECLGGRPGDSPRFDALAREGVLFTGLHAAGTRTNRGLPAVLASIPTPCGASQLRGHAGDDGPSQLGTLLRSRGYASVGVYGGDRDYDNLDTYLRAGGFDRVVARDDFAAPYFETEWGVSDEETFDRALVEFDALHGEGRPFFGFVLTLSNHRPHRVPGGRVQPAAGEESDAARRTAFRYADWSLGRFMDAARGRPWFDRTVFVLVADHGQGRHNSSVPDVSSFRIPLLLFAPGLLPPGRVDGIAGQIDVAPTILGLLGGGWQHGFMGRDLLAGGPPGHAFLAMGDLLMWIEGRLVVAWGPDGRVDVYEFRDGIPHPFSAQALPGARRSAAGPLLRLRSFARTAYSVSRTGDRTEELAASARIPRR